MKPDEKVFPAANQFLASISILEVLLTVQQKAEFADRAIKTILGLNHCGFCLKGYKTLSPIHDTCLGCSVKDEERVDKSFDCPLRNSINHRLIPLCTTESFFGYFLVSGESIEQLSLFEPLLLNFLTILSISIDNLRKNRDLERLNSMLQISGERYRKAQEVGHVGGWEYDIKNGAFWGSDEGKRVYGFNAETDVFNAEEVMKCVIDRDRVNQALIDLIEKNEPYDIEFDIIPLNSSEKRTIHSMAELVRDEKGIPKKVTGVLQDITDRKKAEKALLQEKIFTERLINAPLDTVFLFEPATGKPVRWNKRFTEVSGYKDEEIAGMKAPDDFYDEEDLKYAKEGMVEMLAEGQGILELSLVTKLGMHIPFEYTATVIETIDGKTFLLSMGRDITERKRKEDSLRDTNAYLENLLNYANAPIIVWDPHFRITRFNHAFESLTGRSEAGVIGQSLEILFPPALVDDSMALIRKTLTGERWETVEIKILHRDGSVRTVLWNSATLFLPDGLTPIATIAQGNDITARKQAETALNLKNEELLRTIAEKDKFFSIIAHDLRNPFNAFLGFTQIMAEELNTMTLDQIQKIAISMRNSANNLYQLLENLLEWSRLQRGMITYEPSTFFLMPKISNSMQSVLESARQKEITINYEVPENIEIYADENMFGTLIRNLASNAVKFTHKGGKIVIKARPAMVDSIEISVHDTGIGMNKNMIVNLFRIDENTNRKGTEGELSTGLGLIICKEFMEKHGGKLWVESEEGKGSTFRFTLSNHNQ